MAEAEELVRKAAQKIPPAIMKIFTDDFDLTEKDRKTLIEIAREAIQSITFDNR